MTDRPPCGTYAGAQLHGRLGERKCAACRKAQAAYVKSWRQRGKCVRGLGWPAGAEHK